MGSLEGPWAASRALWELRWDILGVSGDPWGAPGGAWGVFSFLGRAGGGFRENPGNSGSHFGSILDDFLVMFRDIFRLRFFG